MPGPKYPNVKVKPLGEDGNALSILGKVQGAMRKAGVPKEERAAFIEEATSGDYDHLLGTVMRYVEVS